MMSGTGFLCRAILLNCTVLREKEQLYLYRYEMGWGSVRGSLFRILWPAYFAGNVAIGDGLVPAVEIGAIGFVHFLFPAAALVVEFHAGHVSHIGG